MDDFDTLNDSLGEASSPWSFITQAELLVEAETFGAILVPRQSLTEGAVSVAAALRNPMIRAEASVPDPSAKLSHIGLTMLDHPPATATHASALMQARRAQGVAATLHTLGVTVAYFGSRKARDDARGELSADFEFLPNFSLALPTRMAQPNGPRRSQKAPGPQPWFGTAGVTAAHKRGIRGAGVLVGVLDTGIDAGHQAFARRHVRFRYEPLAQGAGTPIDAAGVPRFPFGFDTDGHGTHVCGIIAGKRFGVAPEAELAVASVIESETARTSLIRVVNGLDWLLQVFTRPDARPKPAVINLSLGFPESGLPGMKPGEFRARVNAMGRVIDLLRRAEILTVVAIGNDGPGQISLPGGLPNALGVGAVDAHGVAASFSGSGSAAGKTKPDIFGYGVDVLSCLERDHEGTSYYEALNGTSMAAPFVTGIAALALASRPSLTAKDLETKLIEDAFPLAAGAVPVARFVETR